MGSKLYVGNLSFETSSADLEQMFASHGVVSEASVVTDRDTGRSRGFGFVLMVSEVAAQPAFAAMTGQEHGGRTLTVNVAKPREKSSFGGGGGGRRRF